MNFKNLVSVALALCGLAAGGTAQAIEVTCGGPSGIRVTAVDPGLVGGLCATGIGNLDNSDIATLGLTQIEKDIAPNGMTTGELQYTGSLSGNWEIAASSWTSYQRVFLGFHFGGGDNNGACVVAGTCAGNPDWFVLELVRPTTSGTWELGPIADPQVADLRGLSNIYLLAKDPCTTNCGGIIIEVPEPASLALVGLALLGVGISSRRKQA